MSATQETSDKLKRKREFYDVLERLEKSDGETDQAYETSRRLLSAGLEKEAKAKSKRGAPEPLETAVVAVPAGRASETIPGTPAGPPPSSIPRLKGKGKAADTIKLVPEAQRIFHGLQFFFFPNNDANNARRLRIIKALEFGASGQKDWNTFITHIIVDKDITYSMLLTHLQVTELPSSIILVNETWPADCLSYRALLEPKRMIFAVKGAPSIEKEAAPQPIALPPSLEQTTPSDTSLILKPPGKAVQTKAPSTQRSSPPEQPAKDRGILENDALLATQDDSHSDLPLEFQHIISQARDLASLPLEEQDGESPSTSQASTVSPVSTRYSKTLTYQDRFQCMQSHTGEGDKGPNAQIVDILQQMADYYQQVGDEWRTRAYRKAIGTIRNHNEKISTKEQALAIPNIGERLAEKIEEIAFTHRLRRLDAAQAEPTDQILAHFMKIYGVGYAQASTWVRKGHKSLDDLLSNEKLTYNQQVGVEHFEDFNLRLPRAEVKQHADIVLNALQQADSGFSLIIGGSYRRGSPDCSDVDCVITHSSFDLDRMRSEVVDKVIKPLTVQGFIKAELSAISREEGSKWHGASCLPGSTVWRRMDFLLVPDNEIGAAMIYFTGNDIFNRSMRLLASKKGMRLNQRGLYKDVIRDKGGDRMTNGTLIEGHDERRIFEILGVPWREPWERLI